MTITPPDPDPSDSPDLDAGGSPVGPMTPDSDSTSLASDSARTGQSPTKSNSRVGIVVLLAIVVLVVLVLVFGLVGRMFGLG
ncbi:DUF6480 family protein [Dietzia maris]|uniref:DUF6480 family protein n=1 Tax=Dietzia maris TaxID=37915 RepID=UPI00223AB5A5|nr:DUF6480 family protein [Dietzia maris]MCT1434923.1 DUF6480 family protein [Dietzia maris]MCT1522117.1 DUF6480 family protein [Dietzia maris]